MQDSAAAPTTAAPGNRLWIAAAVLLALAQVAGVGYQLGVGNQSIQIPFLLRLHDPALFPADAMINETLPWYPTRFFHLLAPALGWFALEPLYLALHLLTTAGVLLAAVALCRAMFRDHWSGLVLGLMLLAGHHRALAEETLYSAGFTHTWAVFPLALTALALLYANRPAWAFALAGVLFNLHALEAAHLGAAMGFWAITTLREHGWRRVAGWWALFALAASPTLVPLLLHRQPFDEFWQQLMHIRSAHQIFPSAWWRAGQADVPRFVMILALATVIAGLLPPGRYRTVTLRLAVGIAILFAIGIIGTELWPQATVMRAQLLRSSRFLLMLALAYIAAGCVRAWTMRAWFEALAATIAVLCLAVPAWMTLLPWALVLAVAAALVNHRLHWLTATLAGIAILVSLAAWRTIHFEIPGLSPAMPWAALADWQLPAARVAWLIAGAVAVWWLATRRFVRVFGVGLTLIIAIVTIQLFPRLLAESRGDADWVAVQEWAREHTLTEALFLTPTQPGGFRLHSRRSVVGEWRDGTQLFFCAGFAPTWWARMNELQPGMRLAPEGNRLLVQGRPLGQLDDAQLLALATQSGATHIVVPTAPARSLDRVYHNESWSVYRPRPAPPRAVANDRLARAQRFIADVAEPNILLHRQREQRLQVVDPDGRPVYDAAWQATLTRPAFHFGAPRPAGEHFQYSVITDRAWWSNLEPVEGQRQFDRLEQELAWGQTNQIVTEFSFLSGHLPRWFHGKPGKEQTDRLLQHAEDLVTRYRDRVRYWQVTDQGVLLDRAPALIKRLRTKFPDLKLGLSDTTRFEPVTEAGPRGLAALRSLAEQGAPVDYVAIHGHQPWGSWADPADIYAVLDAFAAAGVRIHITEFGAPSAGWIEGPVRADQWTPALRAEYYRMFYTVAYSHPAVDAIHHTGLAGLELWDEQGHPTPAGETLRELIGGEWRTRAGGELPLDGRLAFRGHHGDYELVVTLPDGHQARGRFRIAPDAPDQLRFQLDAVAGTLTVIQEAE